MSVAAGKGAPPSTGRLLLGIYGPATLLVVALAVLGRFGLLSLGRAFKAAVESGQLSAMDIAVVALCIGLAVVALRVAASRKVQRRAAMPALSLVVVLMALGVKGTLRRGNYHDFHGIWTQSPSQSWTDTRPTLPHITYRHDASGFRGAGFDEKKAPGILRVALVGDSFIFGLGVEENQTLEARLEEELAARGLGGKVEVLNLGVPGANLGTHVRMYRIARETLAADAVVMGVFEDNDLTDWDVQDEITQLAEPSPFSLGCFLLGERPAIILATVLAQARGCTSALAAFAQIEPRLAAMRAQDGAPPLIILDYFTHHAEVRSRFESRPNTSFIATAVNGQKSPEYHIPGDGHPSVRGNQYFAGLVAEKLVAYPAFAAAAAPPR